MVKASYWKIEQLPGISTQEIALLRSHSIHTTQILLERTQTPELKHSLAAHLQIHPQAVNKWAVLSELALIPSVGCYYCGLLLHVGVTSLPQLVQMRADRLHQQILRLQVSTMRRKDLCPPVDQVQKWIAEARSLYQNRQSAGLNG